MEIYSTYTQLNPVETNELNYPYSGQPPCGYGTVTRYTLESIARSVKYSNKQPQECKLKDFPSKDVTARYNPDAVYHFATKFFNNYKTRITEAVRVTEAWLKTEQYSILKSGRQTWSWVDLKNVEAPIALNETIEILEFNLKRIIPDNLLMYINAIEELLDLDEIFIPKGYMISQDIIIGEKKKRITKLSQSNVMKQSELRKRFPQLNTMQKHKERGKLNRRCIATPSMLARGHLLVLETLSKNICRRLPNTGIPVGGNEKKGKMYDILNDPRLSNCKQTMEITGDNTKWNECLSSNAMDDMLDVFLSGAKAQPDLRILIRNALQIFQIKRIVYGTGICFMNLGTKHRQWLNVPEMMPILDQINETDPSLYEILDFINVLNFDEYMVQSPYGMLMGMLNFTSTLLALIALEYDNVSINTPHSNLIIPLESSDDFILVTKSDDKKRLTNYIEKARQRCRLVGVNWSPDKTYGCSPKGIGEFTSMYHDGAFVGNVGVELPGLTTQGINPSTDMAVGTKFIQTAQSNGSLRPAGAYAALSIFERSYRHAYNCPEKGEQRGKRHHYLNKLSLGQTGLTYFGDKFRFTPSTTHLNELAMAYYNKDIPDEYIERMLNPNNPFSPGNKEQVRIDVESKRSAIVEDETPSNILNYDLARNRAIINKPMRYKELVMKEREYKLIDKTVSLIMPEVDLLKVGQSLCIADALVEYFKAEAATCDNLTEDQRKEVREMVQNLEFKLQNPPESGESSSEDEC